VRNPPLKLRITCGAALSILTLFAAVLASAAPASAATTTWYVSPHGDNTTGASWAHAWNEMNQIQWSHVHPGDTVVLDGGAVSCGSEYDFTTTRPGVNCGMVYRTPLTLGASGTSTAPIHVALAGTAGHDGTVVMFGGRATPLPYCHQTSYSYTPGNATEIVIGSVSNVIVSGWHRSGIMVYGAQQGVHFTSDGANHVALRDMEIFDNGTASKSSQGGSSWRTDSEGVALRGSDLLFGRDLVHDNGQDEFQSDEAVATGSIHDLTWANDWIYASRGNPGYPGQPFNDLQAVGASDCTHADGIQIDGGGRQSSLRLNHDIFGPLLNQGLYPSEPSTNTRFDDVTIRNTTFNDVVSHPILSDLSVHNWTLANDTVFQTQGGFEIPGDRGGMAMTDTIKQGGYVVMSSWPSGSVTSSQWYLGDPVAGARQVNPQFAAAPTKTRPTYAELRNIDLTPSCSTCAGLGSPLTTIDALEARIDMLNNNTP
jgi:hypothetical protein